MNSPTAEQQRRDANRRADEILESVRRELAEVPAADLENVKDAAALGSRMVAMVPRNTGGPLGRIIGPVYSTNALTAMWGITRQGVSKRANEGRLFALYVQGKNLFPVFQFPSRPVAAGTRWRRSHRREHEPWYFSSDGIGRFNLSEPWGTGYLASSDYVAARESIGPDIALSGVVTTTFLEGRVVSSLALAESITAAYVSSDEAFPFGVTSELCSMEKYQIPRQWAHAPHDFGFGGIWYHPRFSPGADARAIAVFGPVGAARGQVHEQKDLRSVVQDMAIVIVDPDSWRSSRSSARGDEKPRVPASSR